MSLSEVILTINDLSNAHFIPMTKINHICSDFQSNADEPSLFTQLKSQSEVAGRLLLVLEEYCPSIELTPLSHFINLVSNHFTAELPDSQTHQLLNTLWQLITLLRPDTTPNATPNASGEQASTAEDTSNQTNFGINHDHHAQVAELQARLQSESARVSDLLFELEETQRERDQLKLSLVQNSDQLAILNNDYNKLKKKYQTATNELMDLRAQHQAHTPYQHQFTGLLRAANLISDALSETPHRPPFSDIFTIDILTEDSHAYRREVSYSNQRGTLRYVNTSTQLDLKTLWERESLNTEALGQLNIPVITRLLLSPPTHTPGYSIWARPSLNLVSNLVFENKLTLVEITSIASSLLKALELRADAHVLSLMPREDSIAYDRRRQGITLLEPSAVSQSTLSPPEWSVHMIEDLPLLTREAFERGWVFGACLLMARLLSQTISQLAPSSALNTDQVKKPLKISIVKSARRAKRTFDHEELDDLHLMILAGTSYTPTKRPTVSSVLTFLTKLREDS
jgi:hypothetical protein